MLRGQIGALLVVGDLTAIEQLIEQFIEQCKQTVIEQ